MVNSFLNPLSKIEKVTYIGNGMYSYKIKSGHIDSNLTFDERMELHKMKNKMINSKGKFDKKEKVI